MCPGPLAVRARAMPAGVGGRLARGKRCTHRLARRTPGEPVLRAGGSTSEGSVGGDDGSATDSIAFPPFQTLQKADGFELRLYKPHMIVQVDYTRRDEGYEALGSYLAGGNDSEMLFPESQPVIMTYHPDEVGTPYLWRGTDGSNAEPPQSEEHTGLIEKAEMTTAESGRKSMQVYIPTYDPPAPTRQGLRTDVAGGRVFAVRRFEGYITPETAAQQHLLLQEALQAAGLPTTDAESVGLFRVAQYGPMHSLTPRMNELMLALDL